MLALFSNAYAYQSITKVHYTGDKINKYKNSENSGCFNKDDIY